MGLMQIFGPGLALLVFGLVNICIGNKLMQKTRDPNWRWTWGYMRHVGVVVSIIAFLSMGALVVLSSIYGGE